MSMQPAGIIIWSENFESLLQFYEDLFGIKCHKKKESSAYFLWGDFKFFIGNHSEIKGKSKDSNRIMINIKVDNIKKVVDKLIAQNIVFERMPETESWGGKVATFNDPENNRINLIQIST